MPGVGTAIGAGVGTVAGFILGGQIEKEQEEALKEQDRILKEGEMNALNRNAQRLSLLASGRRFDSGQGEGQAESGVDVQSALSPLAGFQDSKGSQTSGTF